MNPMNIVVMVEAVGLLVLGIALVAKTREVVRLRATIDSIIEIDKAKERLAQFDAMRARWNSATTRVVP